MKSSIRSINEAGLGRRLIAMVMDAVVFLFVTTALILWVFTPIVNKTMNYEELGVTGLRYQVFSDLYVTEVKDESGEVKVVNIAEFDKATGSKNYTALFEYNSEDINFYKDRLHYYYCSYKTGVNTIVLEGKDPLDFIAPDYNILIKDNSGNEVLPKDYYTESWFASLIEGKTTVQDFKTLARKACNDLGKSSYFSELNSKIKKCQVIMIIPAFLISFSGFYILVPLLYKNGETFGKKVMHIAFVTKDGYAVKKRQIVFRQILLLAWISFFTFIFFIITTEVSAIECLVMLGLGVFIYLIATVISKTKRSPIDHAAYTYLVDAATSVWFKDEIEEQKKETELEDKMSKYRRYEPDKSHVIQVGSEIVNEDIKREVEEEKLKNSENKNH